MNKSAKKTWITVGLTTFVTLIILSFLPLFNRCEPNPCDHFPQSGPTECALIGVWSCDESNLNFWQVAFRGQLFSDGKGVRLEK